MKSFLNVITMCLLLISVVTLKGQSLFWQNVTDMPDVRRNHACCYLDGKVYVVGGYNSVISKMNTNFVYDTLTESWTVKSPMSHSRSNLGLVVLNNKVYAVGGDPFLSSIEEFNPDSNSWKQLTPMPTGRQHLGCAVVNNKIYAIGGIVGWSNYTGANEVYNPDSNSWESKTPMPFDRELFGIAAIDSMIYIFGGTNGASLFKTTLCYNANTDTWTTKANMPTARFGCGTAVIDNKIYVIGGGGITGGSISSVDVFNPISNTWETATNMQIARKLVSSASVNGKIFVTGGANSSANAYKSVEMGSMSMAGIENSQLNSDLENLNVYHAGQNIYTSLTVSKNMQIDISFFDLHGRLIKSSKKLKFKKGYNTITTHLDLSGGMYFLVLQTENEYYVKKFILF
ncbi:MAG: T9SS type A sorting domain-containing protein [Saprospiraceae bacterium]|nr:T9SS type A sorting domain-containing protein [Saprospiraceae bacterium]